MSSEKSFWIYISSKFQKLEVREVKIFSFKLIYPNVYDLYSFDSDEKKWNKAYIKKKIENLIRINGNDVI